MRMLSEQRERIFESKDKHRIKFELKKIELEFLFELCRVLQEKKVDSYEGLMPILIEFDESYCKLSGEIRKLLVGSGCYMFPTGFALILQAHVPSAYRYYMEFIRKNNLHSIMKEVAHATYL